MDDGRQDKIFMMGVDIGGTFLRLGIVDQDRCLYEYHQQSSDILFTENAVEDLKQILLEYIGSNSRYNITGIAVGIPGQVSSDGSFVYAVPRIPGLNNADLGRILTKETGIPVHIDRDVNYLLIHDIKTGDLDPRKDRTILGFYIGTGLGNGIWINGNIYRGKHGVSGETGHIPLYEVNDRCACGKIGCAEVRCSGEYLEKIVNSHFPDCFIGDIFTKYGKDKRIQKFIRDLALPLATEITIMDPHTVVIGGGVVGMKDFPQKLFKENLIDKTGCPVTAKDLSVFYSDNVKTAGIIGGCIFLFDKML